MHLAVERYNGDTKELEETDMMSFADSDGGRRPPRGPAEGSRRSADDDPCKHSNSSKSNARHDLLLEQYFAPHEFVRAAATLRQTAKVSVR